MLKQRQFIKKYQEDIFIALININDPKAKYRGDIALAQYEYFYNKGLKDGRKKRKK